MFNLFRDTSTHLRLESIGSLWLLMIASTWEYLPYKIMPMLRISNKFF